MAYERIQREIGKAKELFAAFGETLARDSAILSLVNEYRAAIDRTGKSMERTGVVGVCTSCAAIGPGSCCFQGIEDGYDHVLLLANLLLDCGLPDAAEVPGSCFFLGKKGCKLSARYYFCLHYFCPDLMKHLGESGIHKLLTTIGEELKLGWRLEQALRNWLHRASSA